MKPPEREVILRMDITIKIVSDDWVDQSRLDALSLDEIAKMYAKHFHHPNMAAGDLPGDDGEAYYIADVTCIDPAMDGAPLQRQHDFTEGEFCKHCGAHRERRDQLACID